MADEKEERNLPSPIGKMCFVNVWKPRNQMNNQGDPRYEVVLAIPPRFQKTPAMKALIARCNAVLKEKFGPKASFKAFKSPMRKGDTMPYDGIEDEDLVIKAWSYNKPGVVDKDRQEVLDPDEIYSGTIGRLHVKPFAYDNSGSRGVSMMLNHVQKLGDGPRFDGRKSAEKSFDDVSTDDLDALQDMGIDTSTSDDIDLMTTGDHDVDTTDEAGDEMLA